MDVPDWSNQFSGDRLLNFVFSKCKANHITVLLNVLQYLLALGIKTKVLNHDLPDTLTQHPSLHISPPAFFLPLLLPTLPPATEHLYQLSSWSILPVPHPWPDSPPSSFKPQHCRWGCIHQCILGSCLELGMYKMLNVLLLNNWRNEAGGRQGGKPAGKDYVYVGPCWPNTWS